MKEWAKEEIDSVCELVGGNPEAIIRQLQSRLESLEKTKESLCKALDDAGDSLIEAGAKIESLEKDAARYREYKENSYIRFSLFSGRYRADNGFSLLTDWIESFDECFDTAMQANKGD